MSPTPELTTLLAIHQAITARLDPDAVLQMIADEARRLTGTEMGVVYLLEGATLRSVGYSGDRPSGVPSGYRIPIDRSVAGLAIQSGKPVLVRDASSDPRVIPEVVARARIKSFLVVPLLADSTPSGVILVADKVQGELSQDDERVLTLLASSAAIGLENARLYRAEHNRRLVAEGLRDILATLNSNRPRHLVLDVLVTQAARLFGANGGIIHRADPDAGLDTVEAQTGMAADLLTATTMVGAQTDRNAHDPQPHVVSDLKVLVACLAQDVAPGVRAGLEKLARSFGAWLSVPLVIQGQVYGDISLYYREPHDFAPDELELATILATQAALAIENAQLRLQAEETAASAERNRLARDLHDAVTQTLFSASLIAEVLPRLWERNPPEGRRRLEELRQLTRGALAEMRTLLLELRPAALTEVGFADLLRHLADATTGRARLPVVLRTMGQCTLPPDVQVALYRIAQEGLNNIVKHADATQASIEWLCEPPRVVLTIRDDGRGFDPGTSPPDHLGLRIMRERVAAIGATVTIQSEVGQGTLLTVAWQTPGQSE
jgi:signal transduction histidine kinase